MNNERCALFADRFARHIFQKVDTTTTTVAMSVVEIYIDKVYDLLAKSAVSVQ